MKKSLELVAIIVLSIAITASITYARPNQRFDPGTKTTRDLDFKNIRAGYKIFRTLCKSCHNRQNKTTSFLHTESRTMKGWNNIFYKKYPKCAKQGYWDKLTPDELLNLNDYLYYNAYDSYDPYDPWDNDGFWMFR